MTPLKKYRASYRWIQQEAYRVVQERGRYILDYSNQQRRGSMAGGADTVYCR